MFKHKKYSIALQINCLKLRKNNVGPLETTLHHKWDPNVKRSESYDKKSRIQVS